MSDEDWNAGFVKCLGVRLAGDLINDVDERGEPIVGETLLMLLNGHWEPIPFTLPMPRNQYVWDRILDTADTREVPNLLRGGPGVPAAGPLVRRPGRPPAAGSGAHGHGRSRSGRSLDAAGEAARAGSAGASRRVDDCVGLRGHAAARRESRLS